MPRASQEFCLSQAAEEYWCARQEGAYWEFEGTLAASDGSVKRDMGAGVVLQDEHLSQARVTHAVKVGGDPSSFRAEAAALDQALLHAPSDCPLTVFTDSINVIFALKAFRSQEFARDITRQKNADIIAKILVKVNERTAPTHIMKVKSHRGAHLNELADSAAALAAAADAKEDVPWEYELDRNTSGMRWSWPKPADDPTQPDEMFETDVPRDVYKCWRATAEHQMTAFVRRAGTLGGTFMITNYWGHHLLHKSHLQSPWSTQQRRRWMQHVGRVFPVNGYLRRIDKHPTGQCPWCAPGVFESQTHFQSQCPQFSDNRTAAHHLIAREVITKLKEFKLAGWEFHYETPFSALPFSYEWANAEEADKQLRRRPDAVAWHPHRRVLLLLEFTRAMDTPDNMAAALGKKAEKVFLRCLFVVGSRVFHDPLLFCFESTGFSVHAVIGSLVKDPSGLQGKRLCAKKESKSCPASDGQVKPLGFFLVVVGIRHACS